MSKSIRVICPDCGDVVLHHCHNEVHRAVRALLKWVPEHGLATEGLEKALVKAAKEHEWDADLEKMKKSPFFGSQAWSYPLFGSKDTARTFHALIHNLVRAVGMDPDAIQNEIYLETQTREQAEADRKAGVQKRKDERAKVAAFLKNKKIPMVDRIAKLDEILAKRVMVHKLSPFEKGLDGFSGYLHDWLRTWYGGGISPEINHARVSKLETETYEREHDKA
jgi:hypothetical protein